MPRSGDEKKPPDTVHRITLYLIPLVTTALILFATLKTWHFSWEPHPIHDSAAPPPAELTSCGSTPSKARSLGCHFDILSFAWQTPQCYDAELMDSFINFYNWTFYTQPDRTSETVD